jgi:hypothetical protein
MKNLMIVTFSLMMGLVLAACLPTPIPTATPAAGSAPLSVQLTTAAMNALNIGNYAEATAKSQECIDRFEGQAVRDQQTFTASGSPTPPVGAVADEKRKNEIFARGVLNDVATCYFIKGQALEKLDRISEAKEAYKGSLKFPDSRTWDPAGYFWSPAQGASDRIAKLP